MRRCLLRLLIILIASTLAASPGYARSMVACPCDHAVSCPLHDPCGNQGRAQSGCQCSPAPFGEPASRQIVVTLINHTPWGMSGMATPFGQRPIPETRPPILN